MSVSIETMITQRQEHWKPEYTNYLRRLDRKIGTIKAKRGS